MIKIKSDQSTKPSKQYYNNTNTLIYQPNTNTKASAFKTLSQVREYLKEFPETVILSDDGDE